jgi:hypothetical protein
MPMRLVKDKITRAELEDLAKERFGDLVKAVVDVEKEIMVVGGELHADEETFLIEQGSNQKNLWGINLRFDKPLEDWIEFDSMINLRPSQGNRSRGVDDPAIQKRIITIVKKLVSD